MNREFNIELRARIEILNAADDYESKQSGLGRRMIVEAYEAFNRIEFLPLSFPRLSRHYRIAILKKFPFGLIYRVSRSRVSILRFIPLRSNPTNWMPESRSV